MRIRRLRGVRVFNGLLSAALLAGFMGCSDSTGPGAAAGTYDMDSFNGQKLPAGNGTLFIRSGVLVLDSDGTFDIEMDRDFCVQGDCENDPTHESGTYSIQGIYLTLITSDGFPLDGRIHADYVTLQDGTPASVWLRRD